jgi:xanthosine utilization system XapX-like protein
VVYDDDIIGHSNRRAGLKLLFLLPSIHIIAPAPPRFTLFEFMGAFFSEYRHFLERLINGDDLTAIVAARFA